MNKVQLLVVAEAAAAIIAISAIKKKKLLSRRNRKIWSKKWFLKNKEKKSVLGLLNEELSIEDVESYKNFLRMTEDQFNLLLTLIKADIEKETTNMRDPISAKHRLQITLRFLATGESFRSLMYSTRVHETTISQIVMEVCCALNNRLRETYLKTPNSKEEWTNIANEFRNQWQFPNCLGALDGRHIKFAAPISDGSYYYNYKGENSIVLLALVDANYKFIYINLGGNGRISDAGIFANSSLGKALSSEQNHLNLPEPCFLPWAENVFPKTNFVVIGDDAFPLLPNLLKPYPQRGLSHDKRIFNYRLSRARRVVENAFGILANRFRVLLNPIHLNVNKVETITFTCILLHNFLTKDVESTHLNLAEYEVEGCSLLQIHQQGGNRSSNVARETRDIFKKFFNDMGAVTWQEDEINKSNM